MKRKSVILLIMSIAIISTACTQNNNVDKRNGTVSEKKSVSEKNSKIGGEIKSDASDDENINNNISQADLSSIKKFVRKYYQSTPYEIESLTLDNGKSGIEKSDFPEYKPEDIVIFKVKVKGIDKDRYISVGTKNNWKKCSLISEGY